MTQPDLPEIPEQPKRMRRTEKFAIIFNDGLADGWAFGMPEAFKESLDILYLQYVDKERTKELRKQHPQGEDGRPPTVYRMAWSRGVPPFLNFAVGHIFYDPPDARGMVWAHALKVLRRAVQVTEAKADDPPGTGWVKFTLCHYESGQAARTGNYSLSQAEFETFLRTGQLLPDSLTGRN